MANIKAMMEKLSKLTDENEKLYKENVKVKRERDNLDLILVGVMHSVDKWLTEEEKYGKDEVNRGCAMRAKTLRIVEDLIADKEKLKKENTELKDKLENSPTFFAVVGTKGGKEISSVVETSERQLNIYSSENMAEKLADKLIGHFADDEFYMSVPCKVVIEK